MWSWKTIVPNIKLFFCLLSKPILLNVFTAAISAFKLQNTIFQFIYCHVCFMRLLFFPNNFINEISSHLFELIIKICTWFNPNDAQLWLESLNYLHSWHSWVRLLRNKFCNYVSLWRYERIIRILSSQSLHFCTDVIIMTSYTGYKTHFDPT